MTAEEVTLIKTVVEEQGVDLLVSRVYDSSVSRVLSQLTDEVW